MGLMRSSWAARLAGSASCSFLSFAGVTLAMAVEYVAVEYVAVVWWWC